MKFSSFFNAFTILLTLVVLSSCGRSDLNADLNETLMGEWEVESVFENGIDIFPSTYTAQTYTFDIDDDFPEQGEVTIVSAMIGVNAATTEEYQYGISNEGQTIAWNAEPKQVSVQDSVLTLFVGSGVEQMKITAIIAE